MLFFFLSFVLFLSVLTFLLLFSLQVTTITFAVSPTPPRELRLFRAVMTSERGFGIVRECRTSLTLLGVQNVCGNVHKSAFIQGMSV